MLMILLHLIQKIIIMKIDIPHPDEIDSVGTQIVIHPWDTWSVDVTLSYVIVPLLTKLKETTHSYPSNLGSMDEWHEILDEMIWAFTHKRDNFDTLMDEDHISTQERMTNGFRLFGKYYENLWD